MSEELATTSDSENGSAAVVAAFVIGGIVTATAWVTVSTYGRIKEWRGRRKALREQENTQVVVEEAVQKVKKSN